MNRKDKVLAVAILLYLLAITILIAVQPPKAAPQPQTNAYR